MARAIVFNGTNFELVKKAVPKPRPGHVVVRITIRPLLHADLILLHYVFDGKPIVPGYEGFGLVHSVLLLTHFCTKLLKLLRILMCMKFMAMDYMIGEGVEDELEFTTHKTSTYSIWLSSLISMFIG